MLLDSAHTVNNVLTQSPRSAQDPEGRLVRTKGMAGPLCRQSVIRSRRKRLNGPRSQRAATTQCPEQKSEPTQSLRRRGQLGFPAAKGPVEATKTIYGPDRPTKGDPLKTITSTPFYGAARDDIEDFVSIPEFPNSRRGAFIRVHDL